jgi:alcohol dehydrogenase class IV
MPTLTFLNTCHFDHAAIGLLQKSLDRLGIKRPLIATDKGIAAAGILDTVKARNERWCERHRVRRNARQPHRSSRHGRPETL